MIPNASFIGKETRETNQGMFSRFLKSESAAATIILAVLLLGLVFTMVSIVRLEYVPEWKCAAEQDHMYEIWNDFQELKIRIDMLSRLMESSSYPANDFSITVPFRMGKGDIPVFEPSRSDGKLEVNKERCVMIITLYNSTNEVMKFYNFSCGGITCYLQNKQYPDQFFRYENGALILSDGASSVMRQPPIFTIENETIDGSNSNSNSYTVNIRAVQLSGKADSVSSNTITPLELTGLSSNQVYDSSENENTNLKAFNLTIATKYPDAWISYLNETAKNAGLKYDTDYEIEKRDPDCVYFKFIHTDDKNLDRLCINESVIEAALRVGGSSLSSEDFGSQESGEGDDISESEEDTSENENTMKLNQWYCFETVSGTNVDLSKLKDYDSKSNFLTQKSGKLSDYSSNNAFEHNLNNQLESTFGFNSFTEFESQPNSVTILMVYQCNLNSDPYMTFAGNKLDKTLQKGTGNNWYLYKQDISAASINDPSDLKFYLNIDKKGEGKKYINIDYLAVRPN